MAWNSKRVSVAGFFGGIEAFFTDFDFMIDAHLECLIWRREDIAVRMK